MEKTLPENLEVLVVVLQGVSAIVLLVTITSLDPNRGNT